MTSCRDGVARVSKLKNCRREKTLNKINSKPTKQYPAPSLHQNLTVLVREPEVALLWRNYHVSVGMFANRYVGTFSVGSANLIEPKNTRNNTKPSQPSPPTYSSRLFIDSPSSPLPQILYPPSLDPPPLSPFFSRLTPSALSPSPRLYLSLLLSPLMSLDKNR